jgi:mannose-binding lectin 1
MLRNNKGSTAIPLAHQSNLTHAQLALPAGNTFGITAATPENPDAFEVFKFIVRSSNTGTIPVQQQQQQPQQQPLVERTANIQPDNSRATNEQFTDLTARIQLVNQAANNIIQEMTNQASKTESKHAELLQRLATRDQMATLDTRLQRMEHTLQAIQRDLEGKDYRGQFNQLQETLRSSHKTLSDSLHGTVFDGMSPQPIFSREVRESVDLANAW